MQDQNKQTKRAKTKMLLEHLLNHPSLADELFDHDLDSNEVAGFIANIAKTLWLASTAAKLVGLSRQLELVFYDAYVSAGGTMDEGAFNHFAGHAKPNQNWSH